MSNVSDKSDKSDDMGDKSDDMGDDMGDDRAGKPELADSAGGANNADSAGNANNAGNAHLADEKPLEGSPVADAEQSRLPRTLDAKQIMQIIPHRHPFLLVDRIVDYEPGAWARGIKCVSMGEPVFCGHFPQEQVMPGVLILEALAQTGAIAVLSLEENRGKLAYFGGVRKCRFKRKVVPGDVLELYSELVEQRGSVGHARARATVEGQIACTAEITFAIGG